MAAALARQPEGVRDAVRGAGREAADPAAGPALAWALPRHRDGGRTRFAGLRHQVDTQFRLPPWLRTSLLLPPPTTPPTAPSANINVFWRGRTSRGPSSPADAPMNALGQHSSSRMGTESCCLPRPEPASGGRKTAQATAESSYLLPGMTASGPRARPHRQHGWRHSNLAHSRQGGGGAQG